MDRYSKDLAGDEGRAGRQGAHDAGFRAAGAARGLGQGDRRAVGRSRSSPRSSKVQKAWAKRVVGMQFEMEVDQKMAFDHFFPA